MGDTNNKSELRTALDRALLKESADEVVPGLREQPIPPPSDHDYAIPNTDYEGHRGEMLQWAKFDQAYLSRRRKDSDTLISQCRAQTNCSPRVDAWNAFVDTLNSSHLDALTKIQAVNVWVNEAIYYFEDSKKVKTAFETLSTGTGICDDIAHLKYETLRAVGISDKDMRLVSGHTYDSEDKFRGYHEVLLANVDGQNLILNDNVTSDHFIAGPSLLHGGVEPADVFILGKEGGSAINNSGRFIPLAAGSEDGTKSYPTAFNEKGRYILPLSVPQGMPPRKSDDAGARCTIDAKFCIDIREADPSGQSNGELILQHIAEAIRLRTSPLPKADSHETLIKLDTHNQTVPKQRRDSRSTALKVEASITEPAAAPDTEAAKIEAADKVATEEPDRITGVAMFTPDGDDKTPLSLKIAGVQVVGTGHSRHLEAKAATLLGKNDGDVGVHIDEEGTAISVITDSSKPEGYRIMTPGERAKNETAINQRQDTLAKAQKKFNALLKDMPELKLDFAVGQTAITPEQQKEIAKFVAAAQKLEAAAKAAGFSDWHVKLRVDGSADYSGNASDAKNMELAQARSQNGTQAVAEALKAGGVSAIQVEKGEANIGTKDRSTRIALGRTVNDAEPDINLTTASASAIAAAGATARRTIDNAIQDAKLHGAQTMAALAVGLTSAAAAVPHAARSPDVAALKKIDILAAALKKADVTIGDMPAPDSIGKPKDNSAAQKPSAGQAYTIGV